jgi:hypothetical protein
MSRSRWMRHSLKKISLLPAKMGRYIASGAARIFSPDDDNYPKTGVQPFTGDPAGKSH